MNKPVFDLLAFIVYEDDNGKTQEDQLLPNSQRIRAGNASCARDRFREKNGAALAKAREEHPDGKITIVVDQFGDC